MTKAISVAAKTRQIVKKHGGDKSAMIAVLQDIQEAFNYLPKEALKTASKAMKVPFSRVYEAATFYTAFSLKPRGENIVKICMGTACHVRGASALQDKFERTFWVSNRAKQHPMESFRWKPSTAWAPARWDPLWSLIPNITAK